MDEAGLARFLAYLDSVPPFDAIIMLGVAANSKDFRIELLATDVFRECGGELRGRSDRTLLTTCDMSKVSWLQHLSLYSFDAGMYYCNRLYYEVLTRIYSNPLTNDGCFVPALFIHVPAFEQVSLEEGLPKLKSVIKKAIH